MKLSDPMILMLRSTRTTSVMRAYGFSPSPRSANVPCASTLPDPTHRACVACIDPQHNLRAHTW